MIRAAKGKDDRLSQWVTSLAARSHPNVAAVAMANKTARIAWAMIRNGTDYQPERAASWVCPLGKRDNDDVTRSLPTTIAKQVE